MSLTLFIVLILYLPTYIISINSNIESEDLNTFSVRMYASNTLAMNVILGML